uniref:Isoform B of Probable G-protein coupled receptor Mth-like 7 n=1 Tax=Drosophila melanogaster TaxID=7227 RepID=Q9VSE7-1|nr:methuselah-like 7, isoform B [Drosophila melanogaster]AAO41271.1 methuselah-like 7, isoform B [Drosophila melanogaster]|eukprot:NP_788475.1 methuselah-like 7, isoform B [Drosophila melanogaster]
MRLPWVIFCTVLLLIFTNNSNADIPGCNYYDTVDISYIERQNDSYLYDDIEIPASLTGYYEFRQFGDGSITPIEKHLRACVCSVRPCIRICCPAKNFLANGKCDDGLKEELARFKPYIYFTYMDLQARVPLTDMAIIRDEFFDCDEMIYISDFNYFLEEDGKFWVTVDLFMEKQDYCLYRHNFDSDFPKSMWIIRHRCTSHISPGSLEILIITMICFVLTIAVYLYIKKLRNVTGKCIVCCIVSRFIQCLIMILDHLNLLNGICSPAGYSSHFFRMASNLWLSVISYHTWKVLTSLNRVDPNYRFLRYNAFVWSTAAIMTGSIYIVNQIWENDPSKWNWLPLVGFIRCSVKDWHPSVWIYISGPSLALSTFNVAMFALTAIYIRKVKGGINKFTNEEEGRINCINFDSQTYLQFLRLSIVMGLTWIFNVIPYSARLHIFWEWVGIISEYFHSAFGIVLFVLLVLKRSTWTLMMDS